MLLLAFAAKFCCLDSSPAVDPDNTVAVRFRDKRKLFQLRPDKIGSAFSENAKDFRGFHPDLVIRILQKLRE